MATKLEKISELSKGKGFKKLNDECERECVNNCVGCSVYEVLKHSCDDIWKCAEELLEEYQEPRKLTKRERAFCEYAQNGWLARDRNKYLSFFKEKPCKTIRHDWASYDCDYHHVCDDLFRFITWEDNEPYSVKELLTWEVEG